MRDKERKEGRRVGRGVEMREEKERRGELKNKERKKGRGVDRQGEKEGEGGG